MFERGRGYQSATSSSKSKGAQPNATTPPSKWSTLLRNYKVLVLSKPGYQLFRPSYFLGLLEGGHCILRNSHDITAQPSAFFEFGPSAPFRSIVPLHPLHIGKSWKRVAGSKTPRRFSKARTVHRNFRHRAAQFFILTP